MNKKALILSLVLALPLGRAAVPAAADEHPKGGSEHPTGQEHPTGSHRPASGKPAAGQTQGVATAGTAAQGGTVVDVASAAGQFSTLAKALQEAGLADTLKGAGPFTVFAPTDEAFSKLPAGTLDNLLKDKAQLRRVLLHHVVAGRVTAKDAAAKASAKSLEGASLKMKSAGGSLQVNNARVTGADMAASNGVIHAVDAVLMPPAAKGRKAEGHSKGQEHPKGQEHSHGHGGEHPKGEHPH
jgi:uncharacterized surface protein with fasciclin (FAS1) repeats